MFTRRKSRSLGKSVALTAAFLAVANMAIAQTPYYRYGATAKSGSGDSLPVPGTPPVNGNPVDFERPSSVASYTLRALVGEPVNLAFATSGGSNPITWLPGPTMPAGLSYANGVISGTPEAAAKGSQTVSARDGGGKTAQGRVTFDIADPVVAISGGRPFLRVGAAIQGVIASNVSSPEYTLRGLPGAQSSAPGTDARANLGGTASAPGTFAFAVDVTRPGTAIQATANREIVVENPLEIAFTPAAVPALLEPVDVAVTPLNVAGTPALTLQGSDAALRARGLRYENGRLTGTLTHGAAANLVMRLRDSADGSDVTATLRIPEVINGSSSLVIANEMRQNALPMAATGSTTAATVRTAIPSPICSAGPQTVPGLSISAGCVINGRPSVAGDHALSVSIVPASNTQATPVVATASIKVHPALALASSSTNFDLAPGQPLDLSVTPSGVIGNARFDLVGTTAAQLSQIGLNFNASTGAVTGTPNAGSDVAFSVRVTDTYDNASATRAVTVKSAVAALAANIPYLNLRTGDVRTFVATTNLEAPIFSLINAPAYVRVDERTGVITITAPETEQAAPLVGFTLRAVSETRQGVSREVQVGNPNYGILRPELKIVVAESVRGRGNVALNVPFQIVGAITPMDIAVIGGALPTGMSIRDSAITGTPTVPSIYHPTLRIVDSSDSRAVDRTVEITIDPSLDIAFTGPVSPAGKGTVDTPFNVTASAQNGRGTITFANVPTAAHPTLLSQIGLQISQQGAITGTPTAPMTAQVNIRMTEVDNGVTTVIDRLLSVAVAATQNASGMYPVATMNGTDITSPLYDASLTTIASLPAGQSIQLTFAEPVTVNGLRLYTGTGGTFTVTNDKTGQSFDVLVRAGDEGPYPFTQSTSDTWRVRFKTVAGLSLTTLRLTFGGQAPIAPSFTPQAFTAASYVFVGRAGSYAPSAITNATAPLSWTHGGDLPPGLSVNPLTGVISGTPTQDGNFAFTLKLTDARGISAVDAPLTLRVMPSELAALEFPTITGGLADPQDTLAALYDGQADTVVGFAAGQTLTFTFSKPVFANQLYVPAANGSWTITAVDEGKSFTEDPYYGYSTFRPTSGAMAGAASKVWTVRKGEVGAVHGIVLTGGHTNGAVPTSPFLNYTSNMGATLTSFATKDTPYNLAPYNKHPGYLNGIPLSGEYTVVEGSLPPGVTIDPATGVISGKPTAIGEFVFKASFVSTIPGVRSFPRAINLTVVPKENAATELPTITATLTDPDRANQPIAAGDLLGYVYDGNATAGTASRFNLAAGQQITMTFDKEVAVSTLFASTGASFTVDNLDTGKQVFNGSVPGGGFTPFNGTYGRSFRITASAASIQAYLRLGWSSSAAAAPHLAFGNQPTRAFTGTAISVNLSPAGNQGTMTYEATGLPPNTEVDANGRIVGSPSASGTYVATVRGTDTRGARTAPVTASIVVFDNATAANTIATASAHGGLSSADTSAALMDSTTGTTVTLAPGEAITFNYPSPTLTSGIYFQAAAMQPVEIRDDTNKVQYTGTPGTGFALWGNTGLIAPNGGYALLSSSYTVKNTSLTTALVIQRMAPHYSSSLAAAVVYPHVNANPNVPNIPRTGNYNVTPISAMGHVGTVSAWTITGDLPTGFKFNATTGAISRGSIDATATVPETRDVTIGFTDSRLLPAKLTMRLQVN